MNLGLPGRSSRVACFRLALGGGLWLVAAVACWRLAAAALDPQVPAGRWARSMWSYLTRPPTRVRFELDEPQEVAVGDPLLLNGPRELVRVGEVSGLVEGGNLLAVRRAEVSTVEVHLYPGVSPPASGDLIEYHKAETSLAWVLETLFTPRRREAIAREVDQVLKDHRQAMMTELRPVVEAAVRDVLHVISTDLPISLTRHREDFARLGARYQQELVQQELLPLVQQEIWPIVQRRAEPAVRELGRELWDRVSLWSFTWRAFADKLPFIEGDLVEQEFQRFIKEEVVPTLRRRTPELVEVVRKVLHDVAANRKLRAVARKSFSRLIEDKELAGLLETIFAEVVVQNPRLHQVLRKHWEAPATQQALENVASRLEPALRRIGDQVFGTPSQGVTPEFAAVLRNQILEKDRRWFLWVPLGAGTVETTTIVRPPEGHAYRVRRWQAAGADGAAGRAAGAERASGAREEHSPAAGAAGRQVQGASGAAVEGTPAKAADRTGDQSLRPRRGALANSGTQPSLPPLPRLAK